MIFRLNQKKIEVALKEAVKRGVAVTALIASTSRAGERNLRELELRITSRSDSKLADLKFELLKWLIGLAIAQAGLLVGLKFLP